MDSLRQKLQTLTEEREKAEQAIKSSMTRVVEQQELRKQTVQNFFLFRARGDVDRWVLYSCFHHNRTLRLGNRDEQQKKL